MSWPEAFGSRFRVETSCRRIEQAYKQRPLFDLMEQPKPEQGDLLEAA